MTVPQKYKDFFNKVSPSPWTTPLAQLQSRYEDKVAESRRLNALPMTNLHGIDYIVEMRVREWMMRMQREEAELRRISDAHKKSDRSKDIGPPAPPRPGKGNPPPKP